MDERILGIDHGTVRIGLALSDALCMMANPLKTLDNHPQVELDIAKIVREKRVTEIVVGLPLRMDGHHGSAAERVEKFVDKLKKALDYQIPIHYVDERLSSVSAERSLGLENKKKTVEQKKLVDQVAAVAILQDHLNTRQGPDGWLIPDVDFDFPPR